MGFLESLGKGFVKSAVNQVGRDTGRQVSNAVFKGTATSITGETVSISELNPVKEYIFLKVIGSAILSWCAPIGGGLITLVPAINNVFEKDYRKYYRIEKQEVYVPDRRFKTGKRFEVYKDVKVIYKAPIDESKAKSNKIKGILYFIISISSLVFYGIRIYRYFNK